jgi:hypothetical protein
MADLVVVVPSRGRPEQAHSLLVAFKTTCTAATELVFAVDDNDPTVDDYPGGACVFTSPSRNMGEALHNAVAYFTDDRVIGGPPFAVGFMGDDHLPRTRGWDAAYLDALRELGTGIVYGNDLAQGAGLATQCAMTSNIIRELGYMAPRALVHMYFDNFWMSLGNEAACLRYLPDVIVEHRHPVAGKAAWDEGYARVNSPEMLARDESAFLDYLGSGFRADVEKVLALRGAHV